MPSVIYKNTYFHYNGLLLVVFKEKRQFWKIAIFTAIMAMYAGTHTEIINNDGILRLFLAICQVRFTKIPIFITLAYYWLFSRKKDIKKMTIFTTILPFYLGARTEVINNYGVSRLYLAICQVQKCNIIGTCSFHGKKHF